MANREKDDCLETDKFSVDLSEIIIFEWDIKSDRLTCSRSDGVKVRCKNVYNDAGRNKKLFSLIHPEDVLLLTRFQDKVRQGNLYSSAEFRCLNSEEKYNWCQIYAITQYDSDNIPAKAVGTFWNVQKEKLKLQKLRHRAEKDALTGIYNRETTEEQVQEYLEAQPDSSCALFMIDTDNFKQINDRKGHMLGDVVLSEMAGTMKKLMSENDIVGRIGGDEFTIFMKNISSPTAAEKKAKELSQMFGHLFENEKEAVQVTCSIGVALYPENGKDFNSLYRCADIALYQAKKQGKNRYIMYDKDRPLCTEEAECSFLGTAIDSEKQFSDGPDNLARYVFRILYDMKDMDQAVQTILEIVGKRFDVSRAYVFESSEDGEYCFNTYEWCNDGISPQKEKLQNIKYSQFGDYKTLFADNSVFYCRDIHTLLPEQVEIFEEQGIHSTLQCAFWNENVFSGFVGFDECTGVRLWTKEEVNALSLISQILATFLQKKEVSERNRKIEQELQFVREAGFPVKCGDEDYHIAAEKSIVDCIHCLTSSEYLEDSIEYVLEIIGEYYQSDRVYIIEIDEERSVASNTYEICAKGVKPQKEILQDVSIETIAFWLQGFEAGDYIEVEDVESLGDDRRLEYEILKTQGVQSLLAVPLHVKGAVKGFLGIDDPKRYKKNIRYLKELSYFIENEISKTILQRKLKRMSYQDSMTGLENRNSYAEYCSSFAEQSPVPAGVIFMDINGLKIMNDTKGHICGNMLIMHIADKMKQYFPDGRKFRLSGDEFLIVTEKMEYDRFSKMLHAMTESLSENGRCIVSVGTTWSDVRTDLLQLVNKADRLMHLNKQDYYKKNEKIAAEKMPLFKELLESIINKEFVLYLQPKYCVKEDRIKSAEVLIRYKEKDGTVISPFQFIPLLESEGLISYIDFFVMEEVCRLLTKWKDTGLSHIKLAINFSRITLLDDHFFEQFWSVFQKYSLSPGQLEVEITETQETLNKKQMAQLLEKMKKHGFSIAFDDFGGGNSSYEFLMMTNFDMLKIDKGIIQKYQESEKGEILINHIVEMSHAIGTQCCAEGVETEEQFEFMKRAGCDYVQGYLISRPVPAEQFEEEFMLRQDT
ncbi:EAL domain-containing protein [Anaerostipes sp.]|uniref:EAL domain-containing protein n=1 Tax=Anaerostipes sp. TaxID=1872530 RepID=UPI0025C5A143|nr:EAL domain-containing protein [Anaerostipes sp.]MBS7008087.1 EAL domain-containing protein [Anaerostipes sp.]